MTQTELVAFLKDLQTFRTDRFKRPPIRGTFDDLIYDHLLELERRVQSRIRELVLKADNMALPFQED